MIHWLNYLFQKSRKLEKRRLFSSSLDNPKSILVVALDLASPVNFNVVLVTFSVLSTWHWPSKHHNGLRTALVACLNNLGLSFSEIFPDNVVVSALVPFPLVFLRDWRQSSFLLHLIYCFKNSLHAWYTLLFLLPLFILWQALCIYPNLIRVLGFLLCYLILDKLWQFV